MNDLNDNQSNNSIAMRLFLRQILPFVLVAVLILVGVLGYIVWQKNYNQKVIETPTVSDEEKRLSSETLHDLYDTEAAAQLPEGVSSENYGLNKVVDTELKPKGTIIFSGVIIGSPRITHLYGIDISESTTSQAYRFFPDIQTSAMAEVDNQEEPTRIFYLGTDSLADNVNSINEYNLTNNELSSLGQGEGDGIRSLAWSEEVQTLAFNRLSINMKNTVDLSSPENWEIVIFDSEINSVQHIIKEARQPQWSPDGTQLLYFKVDGLYLYDVVNDYEVHIVVVPEGGKVTGTSMMSLSPDKKYLVWTTAKRGTIAIYEILSWGDAFEMEEVGRIQDSETEFYWPQFSADGKYYVVQAIDTYKYNDEYDAYTRENPRFEIRPILGREITWVYSLKEFAFGLLLTNTWIGDDWQ